MRKKKEVREVIHLHRFVKHFKWSKYSVCEICGLVQEDN